VEQKHWPKVPSEGIPRVPVKVILILKYIQWLSLDITGGAIVLLYALSRTSQINTPWSVYAALGICIWSIYTLDHLKDARKLDHPTSQRRNFHKRFQRWLGVALVFCFGTGLYICYFLPPNLIYPGLSFAGIALVYLLTHTRLSRWGIKELLVAIVYGFGVSLYPLVASNYDIEVIRFASQLSLLAYLNLILISWWDREFDRRDQFSSIFLILSPAAGRMIFLSTFAVLVLVSLLSMLKLGQLYLQFFFLFASLVLVFLFFRKQNKNPSTIDRFLADGIFFLPLIFLWLETILTR
jgi:hypothetical protein